MKIDINKKYRTRDGREARLFTTESRIINAPVTGEVLNEDGEWRSYGWLDNGQSVSRSGNTYPQNDLVEVREPREWDIRVGTNGNTVKGDGRIIAEQLQGDRTPGDRDTFEVIRVREIID